MKTAPKPAWTPKVLEDTDEKLRQELVLLKAQLENRILEFDRMRERLKDSLDRTTAILETHFPVAE